MRTVLDHNACEGIPGKEPHFSVVTGGFGALGKGLYLISPYQVYISSC